MTDRRVLLAALLICCVAGCGQQGPLMLPGTATPPARTDTTGDTATDTAADSESSDEEDE